MSNVPNVFDAPELNSIPFTVREFPRSTVAVNTVLQIPGTGINNVNNNVFIDSSPNNIPIYKFDNATQGSFSPYSTSNGFWSAYFEGGANYLTVPENTVFDVGTGNYTLECWIFPTTISGTQGLLGTHPTALSGGIGIFLNNEVPTGRAFVNGSGTNNSAQGPAITANTWNHLALVRNGTSFVLYTNGEAGISITATVNPNNDSLFYIGMYEGNYFNGYISNVRMVKGTAVYTSNFTPPTAPLTAITNTSLLACQSNRFIDNSSNNFTVTTVGQVSINAFGPFDITPTYTPASMGGSVYFGNEDDFLYNLDPSTPNILNGNFTIEGWFYFNSGSAIETQAFYTNFFETTNEGAIFFGKSEDVGGLVSFWTSNFSSTSPLLSDTTLPPTNCWVHYAVVKNESSMTLYRNGVSVSTATFAGSVSTTAGPIFIGTHGAVPGFLLFLGYMTDFRITNGLALYTSNFTPPNQPLSAGARTSLLIGGRNAAIADVVRKNDIETGGDAKISTLISANGSIYFDGVGDYLQLSSSPLYQFGTGDFTIELWINFANTTGTRFFFVDARSAVTTTAWVFSRNTSNQLEWFSGQTQPFTSTTTLTTTNSWTHIAVSRASGTLRMFINGVDAGGSGTDNTNYNINSNLLTVASRYNNQEYLNGYMNDLRINKGRALYTANFTPPTRS